jgi:hypothetical protein
MIWLAWIGGYLVVALPLAVIVGKMLKRRNEDAG